jgi:(p)ppGpp synthase/HD superfamily hydrolase
VSTLERAITIAGEAHAGQVDKAGAPYVLHPLRMMLRMSSIDERIVAVLHDVCEDCPGWTFDRLRREGFSERIIDALQSVTKRDGETYEDFVRRSAANPTGRRVKLADLHDNSDLSRHRRAVRARLSTHREIPTSNRPDQPASYLKQRV